MGVGFYEVMWMPCCLICVVLRVCIVRWDGEESNLAVQNAGLFILGCCILLSFSQLKF